LGLQPLYDPLKRLWDYIVIQPSYVIFKRGDVILAKNGETGQIEFSGTDASSVIQSAIDALGTQGGKIFIKKGKYEISSSIKLASKIILEGEGKTALLRLKAGVNAPVLTNLDYVNGNSDIAIRSNFVDGNKEEQTAQTSTIYLDNVKNCLLSELWVRGGRRGVDDIARGEGIELYKSSYNIVTDCFIFENDYDGVKLRDASHYNVVDSNVFLNNGASGVQISVNESAYNVISNNNIRTEARAIGPKAYYTRGITLHTGYRNVVIGNMIENVHRGILILDKSRFNLITGNYV